MKKRIVSIITASMMVVLLAACGNEGKKTIPTATPKPNLNIIEPATPTPMVWPEQGEVSEAPTATATPTPTIKPTEKPTATPKPKATATPKPTATPVPQKPEKASYEKGILTGKGFESKWMGLRFTAPEGLELSTQEKLDETMRVMQEALYGDSEVETLDYAQMILVYELEAVWREDDLLMQILVERLPEEAVSVEEYAAQAKEELSQFSGEGIAYIIDDKLYPVNIGGQEFYNYGVAMEYGGEVAMYQEFYLKEQDGRLIMICFSSEKEADSKIQKILDAFAAY